MTPANDVPSSEEQPAKVIELENVTHSEMATRVIKIAMKSSMGGLNSAGFRSTLPCRGVYLILVSCR
jgi:hypothetical protein